jgi:hypothetical protein
MASSSLTCVSIPEKKIAVLRFLRGKDSPKSVFLPSGGKGELIDRRTRGPVEHTRIMPFDEAVFPTTLFRKAEVGKFRSSAAARASSVSEWGSPLRFVLTQPNWTTNNESNWEFER